MSAGSLKAELPGSIDPNPLWPEEAYAFDGGGNIKSIGVKSYVYDGASRLVSASMPTAGSLPYQEYAYDGYGNLILVSRGTAPGNVTTAVPSTANLTNNQLSSAQYDPAGRMISYSQTTYSWDVLDQMAKVDGTAAGSEAWTHVYDAAGERAWSWRTSSSRIDTFTLRGPGGAVLSQFSKTPGAPATYTWKDYVYREGQLLGSRASDGTVKHFDVDHLGTVRLETNASGMKLAYRELWPYGEDATPATNDERLRFTGHERDLGVLGSTADDMDYMHARYYRPLLGRFLSLDPSRSSGQAGRPQSWNRYTYVLSNPLLLVDLDGLRSYLVARNGPFHSSHMFIVTHARYLGDPKARVYSWGKSSAAGREGNVGRVDDSTTGFSKGTATTDRNTWTSLATPGAAQAKEVDYTVIAARDGKVASVAAAVKEDQGYHPIKGPNSNSAAQAVADRAQGSPVRTPTEYDSAQASNESPQIHFDEEQMERDKQAGKHNESAKVIEPPLR